MKTFLLIVIILTNFSAKSQENTDQNSSDTTSLRYYLQHGKATGRLRNFFMATENSNGLSDYYANGLGFGVGFESAPLYHLQIGLSGFFMYNLVSTDLTTPDKLTGAANRYEVGLFDLQDGSSKYLMRLENLYLKYSQSGWTITLGKQGIRTPLLNPQDGRLSPTLIEGALINWKDSLTSVDVGIITQISPRSSNGWYSIGKTVGINPAGVNPDGTKPGYQNNIESSWIAFAGWTHSLNKEFKIQAWDYHADRLFNCGFVQTNGDFELSGNHNKLLTALQLMGETAVENGGNADPEKTYMLPNSRAFAISTRIGYSFLDWKFLVNYTRITGDGRFLFPREWGRDAFFTFMLRERNEGAGDVNAVNCVINYEIYNGFTADLSYGHYYMPDVKNYRLNKYGLPSYNQFNIDIRYKGGGLLRGLDLQVLTSYKGLLGEIYGNEKYVINRVRMANLNFITNYNF